MLSLPSWSRWPRILAFAPALSLAVAGTALAAGSHGISLTTRSAASALVKTAPAQILTNAHGMTLYLYTPDKKNKSVCYDQCAEYWPPATVPRGMAVPHTIAGITGTFGTTTRRDGSRQLTFDGAPLYTWINDKKQGDMTGQGVGYVWWVLMTGTRAVTDNALVKTTTERVLVNGKGMTLYLYTPDKRNKTVCNGECAEYWPPLLAPKGATVPATLPGIPGTFGTTTRTGGARQVTYDGAPLYTWIKDKKPGDMTGQGVGHVWWVMVAPMPKAAATSTSGTQVEATSTPQQGQTATPTPSSYYGGHGRHDGDG